MRLLHKASCNSCQPPEREEAPSSFALPVQFVWNPEHLSQPVLFYLSISTSVFFLLCVFHGAWHIVGDQCTVGAQLLIAAQTMVQSTLIFRPSGEPAIFLQGRGLVALGNQIRSVTFLLSGVTQVSVFRKWALTIWRLGPGQPLMWIINQAVFLGAGAEGPCSASPTCGETAVPHTAVGQGTPQEVYCSVRTWALQ